MAGTGVDMIVGCNGLVWVGPHDASKSAEAQAAAHAKEEAVLVMPTMPTFSLQQRAQAARVANAVRALAILYLPVHSRSIRDTCQVATPSPSFSAGACKGGLAEPPLLIMPSCALQQFAAPRQIALMMHALWSARLCLHEHPASWTPARCHPLPPPPFAYVESTCGDHTQTRLQHRKCDISDMSTNFEG